jgi:hypothetical protein
MSCIIHFNVDFSDAVLDSCCCTSFGSSTISFASITSGVVVGSSTFVGSVGFVCFVGSSTPL